MELLAPAGNPQSFKSALEAGADAIYLGLPWFNARRPAMNFTPETLKTSLSEAREKGVKVYVTLNTDLKSSEIEDAAKVLKLLAELDVDAVIIKDFGLYFLARECYPSLELHLSTQFGISNSYSAAEAKKMGASRVIPARELSFNELNRLNNSNKDLPEIEAFVQGSMCFSFSGKCLLSSWVGGKSANRGVCQAPCRLKYTHNDISSPYFSMKDLNLVSYLDKLKEVNVSSLKIEGRLKSPGWVGNITSIYSDSLKGKDEQSYDVLLKHSGREMGEGFTTGLENLTSKHSVRFGKYLGKVIGLEEKNGENYAILDFIKKDENTSLRFISENDEFLTIIHSSDSKIIENENGTGLIKNIGKVKVNSYVYEVIPARSEKTGIGKFKYDVELELSGDDILINLYTDDGIFRDREKYKKVIKAKRGVYPDAIYDKLSNKVVNGWRLNKLYSEDILLSKTQVNSIVKIVSYILAVTIQESNPLNKIELESSVKKFIDINPKGSSSKEHNYTRVNFNNTVYSKGDLIVDEISNDKEGLKRLVSLSEDRKVVISLFPIMFENDILEIKDIIMYLESKGHFIYEINDIGHYNLLVGELNIPVDRLVGGQGIACYNHLSLRFLKDELGINSLAVPMELDSRGVLKLIEDNNNYAQLRFTSLAPIPGMYSRAQSQDFYEGAEFIDRIGTVMRVHKYKDINIFYIGEYFSSEGCKDLENIEFNEVIKFQECLDNPSIKRKSFNLERRLY